MGEWSDAVEDGVICAGCHLPFADMSWHRPRMCEYCERAPRELDMRPGTKRNPLGRKKAT